MRLFILDIFVTGQNGFCQEWFLKTRTCFFSSISIPHSFFLMIQSFFLSLLLSLCITICLTFSLSLSLSLYLLFSLRLSLLFWFSLHISQSRYKLRQNIKKLYYKYFLKYNTMHVLENVYIFMRINTTFSLLKIFLIGENLYIKKY